MLSRVLVSGPFVVLLTATAGLLTASCKQTITAGDGSSREGAGQVAPAAIPGVAVPLPQASIGVPVPQAPQAASPAKGGVVTGNKTYCAYAWEEKPGYADYTTLDQYELSQGRSGSKKVDRAQNETLQGSGKLSGGLCANAKVLFPCYVTAVAHDEAGNAPGLVRWVKAKGLSLARVKMAFAYQETHLGSVKDSCSAGTCNGIGIAQIITAIKPGGGTLGNADPLWSAIAFNVLTNLAYSSRVLESKLSELGNGTSLVELARRYNGNPDSSIRIPYGTLVQDHYDKLGSCGIAF